MHRLRLYYFIGGGLSMVGTGLVSITYLRARRYIRNEIFEMLLRLMMCDFIYSTKWILPGLLGHLGNHEDVNNWDCIYEAIVDSFFGMSTIMWYLIIAWRVYMQTKSLEVKRKDIPWSIHIFVWGISTIVTVIPLSLHMITEDALDTGTCMLMGKHSSLLFGIPLCLFILAALALLIHTVRLWCCLKKSTPILYGGLGERKGSFDRRLSVPGQRMTNNRLVSLDNAQMAYEIRRDRALIRLRKVTFYLMVFVTFWGSLVVVRIWRLVRRDNTPFILEAIMALSLSLQGFVNSSLWLCEGSLGPWLCTGCCGRCRAVPANMTRNLSFGSIEDNLAAAPNEFNYNRIASNEYGARFLEEVLEHSKNQLSVGMTPPNGEEPPYLPGDFLDEPRPTPRTISERDIAVSAQLESI